MEQYRLLNLWRVITIKMNQIDELERYVKENKERIKIAYNLEDVCVGYKVVNGVRTDTPCIRMFPKRKGEFEPHTMVPKKVDGYPTDVEEEPVFDAQAYTGTYRPVRMGCSISNYGTGTAGFLYKKEGKY